MPRARPRSQLCLLHHWMTIPYLTREHCPAFDWYKYVCVCTCLLVLPYVLLCSLKLKKIPNRRLGPLLCRLMSGLSSSSRGSICWIPCHFLEHQICTVHEKYIKPTHDLLVIWFFNETGGLFPQLVIYTIKIEIIKTLSHQD